MDFFSAPSAEAGKTASGSSIADSCSTVCSGLSRASVGAVRHISAEELSIHISAIAAKADQARACGDRHGSHLYALQMVDAVKDHYKAAARERVALDELSFHGEWARDLMREGWGV